RNDFAARRGNAHHTERRILADQNVPVTIPRSTSGGGRIGECLRWGSAKIDPLQLSFRKKPNRSTVRRPEGITCAIGSRQWLCCHRVERSQPQARYTFIGRDERQFATVR